MKFNDLAKEDLSDKILNITEENISDFFSEERDVIMLHGNCSYNAIHNQGEYYCLGEEKTFSSLKKLVEYLNEEYNENIELPITEELAYAKFRYRSKYPNKGYQIHDSKPKILVLDNDYIYDGKGNIKPGRHDILGFNLNYSENKKVDKKAVQEIVSFAHLLKKNKKDVYKRLKDLYPKIVKDNIRCYKPQQMTKLRKKDGFFWKQCSVSDLAPTNNWE